MGRTEEKESNRRCVGERGYGGRVSGRRGEKMLFSAETIYIISFFRLLTFRQALLGGPSQTCGISVRRG
jgi:hypothetical protein